MALLETAGAMEDLQPHLPPLGTKRSRQKARTISVFPGLKGKSKSLFTFKAQEDADADTRPSTAGGIPKLSDSLFSPVVNDNPFFDGTSAEFKQELIPHIVCRYFGAKRSDSEVVRTLIEQGTEPAEEFDGLLLTDAHFDGGIELVFTAFTVSTLQCNAALGAETLLGITQRPILGVRWRTVLAEASDTSRWPIFLIPRQDFLTTLSKPGFAADRDLLYERVLTSLQSTVYNWSCHHSARLQIRLFANVNATFKHRLIQSVSMQFFAAGASILKYREIGSSAILVADGEAEVVCDDQHVAQLSQTGKTVSAWSAWWALLEATGACLRRPAHVTAVTDCVVWFIERDALKGLREEFPVECGHFDKVAEKHVKLLSPYTMDFTSVPLLRGCDSGFLAYLTLTCTQRICQPGDYITTEGDHGSEMFLLARGQALVYVASAGCNSIASKTEGDCFGELAVLGITERRMASVVCETICDLRVLDRHNLLRALVQFPKQTETMGKVAHGYGYGNEGKLLIEDVKNLDIFQGFSREFVEKLSEHLEEQAFFLGQTLVQQDERSDVMYVVTAGKLGLEVSGNQCVELVGPAIFCEAALANPEGQAPATIRCLTMCQCFAFNVRNVTTRFQDDFVEDITKLQALGTTRHEMMLEGLLEKFDNLLEASISGIDQGVPAGPIYLGQAGSFFKDSDRPFIEELNLHLEKRIFFPGQVLISEGEAGSVGFLVHTGVGVVESGGQRVAEIRRGNFVGEAVVLGLAQTYSCTIKASGLVAAFCLDKDHFQGVVEKFDYEKMRLEELMNKRRDLTRYLTKAKGLSAFSKPGDDPSNSVPASSTRRASFQGTAGLDMLLLHKDAPTKLSPLAKRISVCPSSPPTSPRAKLASAGSLQGDKSNSDVATTRSRFLSGVSNPNSDADDDASSLSDSETSDRSKDQKPVRRTQRARSTAKTLGRLWVTKRKEAIQHAHRRRDLNLKRHGRIFAVVPPTCGYRASQTGFGTAFADCKRGGEMPVTSTMMRFRKTTSVYGRPVWNEVFGAPVRLPPI